MASTGRQAHRRPRPLRDVAVRSADPFEARAVGTRVYHDHRLEVLGDARAFAMNLEAASIGPVTIGWLTYDTEVRIETPEFADSYQVNLLTGGVMSARCGDQEITATPGRAMVYRPDRPTGFSGWRTPEPLLALKVERRALEHALERLLDRPVERPIAFSLGFDVGGGRGAQWSGLLHAA
ncbi:MAG: hypothetical protein JO168_05585, partial [Solirubrobacterales bacterium]|nr:hypothetical protein [Solirubrobacterales bacterium]